MTNRIIILNSCFQGEFHTALTLLLSPRSVYVILLDLTKGLDETIKTRRGRGDELVEMSVTGKTTHFLYRGIPLITYAPRGREGVKPPIHFYCVLHAKRGEGGPDSMSNCVRK